MDPGQINQNEPWEFSLDIDDSDLKLTPSIRPSTNTHVQPAPFNPTPVHFIPGPAGVIQVSNTTPAEPCNTNNVRIIPGPAGVYQRANMLKESVFILNPDGALMSTQEYAEKVVEDVGEDVDFNSGVWLSAVNYVSAQGGDVAWCLGDIDNNLIKGKLDLVVGIVKTCSPNVPGDLNVTLKDLTGTTPGTIHYKWLNEDNNKKDITVGAAMIIRNVFVISPKSGGNFFNITKRNVVAVFPRVTLPGSGSGVVKS